MAREDEGYLWPGEVDHAGLKGAELIATYPRRADVPGPLWIDLLRQASRNVDVLAFAGLFLTEDHPGWVPLLGERAEAGSRLRLLLGDPAGAQLAAPDLENKIGGGGAGRVTAGLSDFPAPAG